MGKLHFFPRSLLQIKTPSLPFFRYAVVTSAHIYIYYLTTTQTAITIELHVFFKRLI